MSTIESKALSGRCTCGQVRFRVTGSPLFVHCCHCSWCQRETGSAFALNAMYESGRVELLAGATETVDTPSNSGKGQRIVRCTRCRVAVWSHYAGAGDAVAFVRVGALETPADLPPDVHIFTETKLPWVVLPVDVPSVEAYYPVREYWPAESLARLKAAKEGRSS